MAGCGPNDADGGSTPSAGRRGRRNDADGGTTRTVERRGRRGRRNDADDGAAEGRVGGRVDWSALPAPRPVVSIPYLAFCCGPLLLPRGHEHYFLANLHRQTEGIEHLRQ